MDKHPNYAPNSILLQYDSCKGTEKETIIQEICKLIPKNIKEQIAKSEKLKSTPRIYPIGKRGEYVY